ncbi:MAG TPA: hypothetical protein PLC07_09965 [Bacillota bacterium]|nr:hypothetical protein [Bacillota bacterium]HPT88347.1 hypothetical protein [Bacillota bacterium]
MAQLEVANTYLPGDSAIANGLVQTESGDYILAGRVFEPDGDSSAVAIRVDASGNVIWEEVYQSAFTVFFKAVALAGNGDIVATGSFFYSESAGDEYIWVVRLDPDGQILWQEAFGSTGEQSDGQDIASTADGGFVVAGYFIEKGSNVGGTRVLKFDAMNQLEWDKRYDTGIAFSIEPTRDGGYILTGARNIPGSLNSHIFVLKLDGEGNRVWERIYDEFEIFVLLDSEIAETEEGNFVIAAKSVVMQIDCCGNIIWAHQRGDLNVTTVTVLPEQGLAVGGSLIVNNFDHAYVAALDSDGTTLRWDNHEISFPSGITQIILNQEGQVAATGYLPVDNNQSQMFLAVYNPVTMLFPE